jgi:hypothetical protein
MVTPRVSNHRIAANYNKECKLYYGSTEIYEKKQNEHGEIHRQFSISLHFIRET